jgi:hypothetical protein
VEINSLITGGGPLTLSGVRADQSTTDLSPTTPFFFPPPISPGGLAATGVTIRDVGNPTEVLTVTLSSPATGFGGAQLLNAKDDSVTGFSSGH